MRRLGLFLSWLLATVLVTVAAFRVVGAAESQVGDAPLTPVVAISEPDTVSTTTATTATTTTPRSTATPSTTTTTTVVSPTTTVAGAGTTTTTPPPTTTTTPATTGWITMNIPTAGGTVTVEHRSGEIRLVAATAGAGYRVGEIEPGPPEVEVEFERGETTIDVRVRWSDEGPSVEIRTDSDGDHDDD